MRYNGYWAGLLFFVLVAAGQGVTRGEEPAQPVFQENVNLAWQTAQASQRPLLLFVTTQGCYYCEKMLETTYQDEEVTRRLSYDFVAAKVYYEREPRLAQKLGVRAFPTTVIIGTDGQVRDSIRGYVKPEELRARMIAANPTPTRQ